MPALPRPDRDQLSTLGALVILAIGLVRVVAPPTLPFELAAAGLVLRVELNSAFVLIVLAAAVTVAGADWLVRTHPRPRQGLARLESVIVPGLATLAAGAILVRVESGPILWIGLALAAAALMAVLLAEFVVVDPADPRREIASIGLTVLAQLLLTGVYFALYGLGVRGAFSVPIVFVAAAGVSWRLLRLHLPDSDPRPLAVVIGAILAELSWALHYWPLAPIQPTLFLGLLGYLSIQAVISHRRGQLTPLRALEYWIIAALGLTGIVLLT